MAKAVTQPSDPVTDGPEAPVSAPTVAVQAKETPKPVIPPNPNPVPVIAAKEPEPTAEEIADLERRIAKWKENRALATSGDPIPFGMVARYFKVSLPHNPPLIVRVVSDKNALNWGELAIREFNRIRGVTSTVHTHTVEDAESVDA